MVAPGFALLCSKIPLTVYWLQHRLFQTLIHEHGCESTAGSSTALRAVELSQAAGLQAHRKLLLVAPRPDGLPIPSSQFISGSCMTTKVPKSALRIDAQIWMNLIRSHSNLETATQSCTQSESCHQAWCTLSWKGHSWLVATAIKFTTKMGCCKSTSDTCTAHMLRRHRQL